MKRILTVLLLAAVGLMPVFAKKPKRFEGRWDLTVSSPRGTYPSWFEYTPKDGVRIVGRVASVHPATDLKIEKARMTFTTSEWLGRPTKVMWDVSVKNGKLSGSEKLPDGTTLSFTGVPAPALKRKEPKWSEPEALFNGKDLTGWEPFDSPENHWVAHDGQLVNEKAGANLRTTRKFEDFKLHVEFNCPDRGNSGIYLRGRYEVQVEYEPSEDKFHMMGSVYGFLAPAVESPRKPGEWESFDITLVGRTVTVVRNGVTTIDHREIPGITGGALESDEGAPGPIYLQGDHTGGMKYRNLTVSVGRK